MRRGGRCAGDLVALGCVLLSLCSPSRASAQVIVEPDRSIPTGYPIQYYPGGWNPVVATSAGTSLHARGYGGPLDGSTFLLSRSQDDGLTWVPFQTLSYPPSLREGQAALAADSSGTFYLLWREFVSGSSHALLLDRLTFSGDTPVWAPPLRIVPGDLELIQPTIACDPRHRSLYVAYVWKTGATEPLQSDVWFLRSGDLGDTWTAPTNLSGPGCDRPQVAVGPDGEVYVLWVDAAAGLVRGRRSNDQGTTFGSPFVVGPLFDNRNTTPYEYVVSGYDYDINYVFSRMYPNLLRVAVDRSNGPQRGRLYAAWCDRATGTVGPLGTSRVDTEPNNSMATAQACEIGDDIGGFLNSADCIGCDGFDLWRFAGRAGQTLQITGSVAFNPPNLDGYPDRTTLTLACSTGVDTIAPVTRSTIAIPGYPVAPMIVTLPRTGSYYFAMTNGGPSSQRYSVSIRELHVSPGSVARDQRDIVLSSSGDGGQTWQKVRVNDSPPQYDESLPEIVVDGQGTLHATWLDRRDAPLGYGERTNAYWSYSFDGGRTFAPGTRLSSGSTTWRSYAGFEQIAGEHNALAVLGQWVCAFWVDNRRTVIDPNDYWTDMWYTRARVDAIVSIAVPRFVATADAGGVRLEWSVQDGRGISGFRVHRAAAGSDEFVPLGAGVLPLLGDVEHAFVDGTAAADESYRYRLEVLHGRGASTWEGPTEFSTPRPVSTLRWSRPWPNPTEASSRLTLQVPRQGRAEVGVYDIAGKRVSQLHSGPLAAGAHEWLWPAPSVSRPAPGVYLVRADLAGEVVTSRVVLIR